MELNGSKLLVKLPYMLTLKGLGSLLLEPGLGEFGPASIPKRPGPTLLALDGRKFGNAIRFCVVVQNS